MTASKNWYCSLPWTGFSNDPDGKVRPCCIYKGHISDDNGNPYYVQNVSVKEIFKSTYMKNLRQQFRNGEKPSGCETCIRDESNNFRSKRETYLSFLSNQLEIFDTEPELPVEYQMIISNACNLKCRSCTPSHSNLWQAEHKILFGNTGYQTPHGQAGNYDSVLWKDRKEWMSSVKRLEIVGGEPFYIRQWKELWTEMIELGYSKNVDMDMSTNCNIFDIESLEMIIKDFKRIGIGLSIDGLGKVYNYLRHPGKWDQVQENILSYYNLTKKHKKNFNISYTHTIGWINAWYLPEFHEWTRLNTPGVYIWHNVIHFPEHMALYMIPDNIKELIIKKWQNYNWSNYENDISGLINFMNSKSLSDKILRENYSKFKINDEFRQENLLDILPAEFKNIINVYLIN